MGGQRGTARYLTYTTPVAVYRTSSGNDAAVGDVTEVIDLSNSDVALNKLVLYIDGAAGDELRVWVDDGDDNWYVHSNIELGYPAEVVVVDNVPVGLVKIQNVAVDGAVAIKEEHTE